MENNEPIRAALPPTSNDSLYEIVNGQYVPLPSMSIYATWIMSRLSFRLGPFVEEQRLGTVVTEGLFILDVERNLRRRPDIAFVSARRWPLDKPWPETGDWQIIPDLAIEIISPNDLFEAVLAKVYEYFEYGMEQVWVVSPLEQKIYIYDGVNNIRIVTATEELQGIDLLPGFRLPLSTLFTRTQVAGSA